MKTTVFNGENYAITVVSDGNPDTVIPAKGMVEIDLDLCTSHNLNGAHVFNQGSFYVLEDGDWTLKYENNYTGYDLEIYNAK
jgi:hypothetical protein